MQTMQPIQTMLTYYDVLNRIAEDIHKDQQRTRYDFNMCITDDFNQAKEDFTNKYGRGKYYYFPIENYAHGKELARDIYYHLSDKSIAVPESSNDNTAPLTKLFLYIHLSPIKAA